jgi:hypothetical protein
MMLGFWQEGVIQMLRQRRELNFLTNRRNLHVEPVSLRDIPFAMMATRLRKIMALVGSFEQQKVG